MQQDQKSHGGTTTAPYTVPQQVTDYLNEIRQDQSRFLSFFTEICSLGRNVKGVQEQQLLDVINKSWASSR